MELNKYIKAQEYCIDTVKEELRDGLKQTHWMWFVFPQLKGLGKSIVSDYFGLKSLDEAKEFFENKYLRKNLVTCFKLVLKLNDHRRLSYCFGVVDTMKIHSCATLFYLATRRIIFKKFLDKFFGGSLDDKTVLLLN